MILHKYIILALSSALFLLSAVACSDNDDPVDVTPSRRALLVYMVADNSLGKKDFDSLDLAEMSAAAANGDLGSSRLLVYHSSARQAPQLKEITPSGIKLIKSYPYSPSSVSVERMKEVISDFDKAAPAIDRGLILWSHASAWIQNGISNPSASVKSWGDERGRYMNIPDLADAVADASFVFIYFDCCYMANIESLYELRDATPRVVASTTEIPAGGMPYDRTLRFLAADSPDLRAAALATFRHYDSLSGSDRTCTISVIDMTSLPRLADATARIYQAADSPQNYSPQPFMTSGCYLFDMSDYINSFDAPQELLLQWNEAFHNTVIFSAATPMIWNRVPLDRANGLSTYIIGPTRPSSFRGYDSLDWWRDVASFIH